MAFRRFTIKSKYEFVALLNSEIRTFFTEKNVSDKICNDIEICMTEALNNVIKHSYKEEPTKQIDVLAMVNVENVELRIIDSGIPRKNKKIPRLEYNPEDIENLPESGMGLYVIQELMDDTKYRISEGKNMFTLIKNL